MSSQLSPRELLLKLLTQANDLVITNTLFQQPLRRRYTWISPGDRDRNQIDYIMVDKSWKSSILKSKTRPGADCDTDHIFVVADLRLKAHKTPKAKPSPKYNIDSLLNPDTALGFKMELSNRFSLLTNEWIFKDTYPDEIWNEMKTVFADTADAKLGRKKYRKPKPYISEEVMELAKRKSQARKTGKNIEYSDLKREIKSKVRRDKKKWLEEECAKINKHNENRKSRELFEQIKKVKNSNFSANTKCIKNNRRT